MSKPISLVVDFQLLPRSWQRICQAFGLQALQRLEQQTYQHLLQHYSQPGRAYHNLQHLTECIRHFEQVQHLCVQPTEVEIALWFHDAVYDSHAIDNEQKSAAWAVDFLQQAQAEASKIQRVCDLIMATRQHQGVDIDQQLMVDIDLSILGSSPMRFDEYMQQIRREYSFVATEVFRQKRMEVLQQFYQRQRIYNTDYFYQHYEQAARNNIQHALSTV
ncbi:metal-dependent hydrolase [Alkanindiges sp. WGS2144]|uniref:HD domain-containing protein n=1 Tax=Alkanindiges sp. WGS2144 TaxID=3366808 RepID=UPI0037502D36